LTVLPAKVLLPVWSRSPRNIGQGLTASSAKTGAGIKETRNKTVAIVQAANLFNGSPLTIFTV